MRAILPIVGLLCLPGCATLVEGSSQSVSVSTIPAGATYSVDRNGERLGLIGATPGNLTVSKSKRDLEFTCSKDGYLQGKLSQPSKFVGTTFGNIIAGGLVGVAVDASSGANFTYPKEVELTLIPSGPVAPPLAAAPGVPAYVPPYTGS